MTDASGDAAADAYADARPCTRCSTGAPPPASVMQRWYAFRYSSHSGRAFSGCFLVEPHARRIASRMFKARMRRDLSRVRTPDLTIRVRR